MTLEVFLFSSVLARAFVIVLGFEIWVDLCASLLCEKVFELLI